MTGRLIDLALFVSDRARVAVLTLAAIAVLKLVLDLLCGS